jgi:hypothetical protein
VVRVTVPWVRIPPFPPINPDIPYSNSPRQQEQNTVSYAFFAGQGDIPAELSGEILDDAEAEAFDGVAGKQEDIVGDPV